MNSKITVSSQIQINNPCNRSDLYSYVGPLMIDNRPIEVFNSYPTQKANLEKLQASLEPFGLKLNFIWAGIFKSHGNRFHFVAKDENDKIFWQKYESRSPASGQNHLYVNGKRIKVTRWLAMTPDQRAYFYENGQDI